MFKASKPHELPQHLPTLLKYQPHTHRCGSSTAAWVPCESRISRGKQFNLKTNLCEIELLEKCLNKFASSSHISFDMLKSLRRASFFLQQPLTLNLHPKVKPRRIASVLVHALVTCCVQWCSFRKIKGFPHECSICFAHVWSFIPTTTI